MGSRTDRAEWRSQLWDLNASVHEDAASRGRIRPSMFSCECGKPNCFEAVLFDLAEYEALRARGGYILAAGHHVSRAEDVRRVARKLREDSQALRAQAEYQRRRLRRLLGR